MADSSGGGFIGVIRLWASGLIMLGGIYLIGTEGTGIATGIKAAGGFFSSTEGTVLQGGK